MPPIPTPMMTPVRSGAGSGLGKPASSTAMWAAPSAYRMKRSIFFKSLRSRKRSASKSRTSPAIRAGSTEASKRTDQHGDDDRDVAPEARHHAAARELEPATALRLHHVRRRVEERRHEAEGEGQREADGVRHAQPTESIRDLLDPGDAEEE